MAFTPQKPICSVSVDLDPLSAYYRIHGLGPAPTTLTATIVRQAIPRFLELFADAGIQATLFVVGSELDCVTETAPLLKNAVAAGHELANHTYSHPYELNRLSADKIHQELADAHDAIVRCVGPEHAPVGFRAPGYFANSTVMQTLVSLGYRYDSSMFPSVPYYVAKAVVMRAMVLRGRHSGAVLADPRSLTAPLDPYRPDLTQPWRRGNAPLVELPVAVLEHSRVPAIGTLFAVGPKWLRAHALAQMKTRPFFNLEFHGIDLIDAVADRIPTALAGRQPDLRVPYAQKRDLFAQLFAELKSSFEFTTLKDAADRF